MLRQSFLTFIPRLNPYSNGTMYLIPGSKSRTPGITTGLNPYSNGTMYLI